MVGNSLLRLVLECIQNWAQWFPIDPATKKKSKLSNTYEKLLLSGVKFPSISTYFKNDPSKDNNNKMQNSEKASEKRENERPRAHPINVGKTQIDNIFI